MTLVDKIPEQKLRKMAKECVTMKEFARKIGYQSTACFDTIRKKCEEFDISLEHFTGVARGTIKRSPENVFIENSTASQAVLRTWYKKGNYTEYKCSICGLSPVWNGKELTLTLDHINGINHDDRLENLRWVCPNCDRQLDTFCAKNANRKTFYNYKPKAQNYCIDCGKSIDISATRCVECYGKSKRIVDRPDAEELEQIMLEHNGNFTAVGKMFGVTDNSIRKWCKSYNLPTSSASYKKK